MNRSKIEHLKEKRILLKKEIRLKEHRERIANELEYLENQNFTFNIYYDYRYVNWINDNVKVRNKDGYRGSHGDFQIDVNAVDAITTIMVKEDDFLTINPIAEFFNNILNDTEFIICSLSNNPELKITKEAFLSKPSLFLSNAETWVLSSDKKYIIEKIWSQEVIRFIDITKPEPVLRVKALISL